MLKESRRSSKRPEKIRKINTKAFYLNPIKDNKKSKLFLLPLLGFKIRNTTCFLFSNLFWRRVGDSNSRSRSLQTNDLANRPLQPLG